MVTKKSSAASKRLQDFWRLRLRLRPSLLDHREFFFQIQHDHPLVAGDRRHREMLQLQESPAGRWSSSIGVVIAILGNILISVALNIQRYAHIRLQRERERNGSAEEERDRRGREGNTGRSVAAEGGEEDDSDSDNDSDSDSSTSTSTSATSRPSYLSSPFWWAGQALFAIGECGNFIAYGFAPASIVSPLGVVALVSNCIIAPVILKERFRSQDGAGVVVAIAGAVTVVLSAEQGETKLGPHEITSAVTRLAFEVYMAVTIILIAILMAISPRYGHKTILVDLGLVGLLGKCTSSSSSPPP